jgi:general secretion pathway protein A
LLVGQTGILPTLDRMAQLEERLGVKCLLRPFSAAETAEYVVHRLHAAGAGEAIFDPDAMAEIHRLTHGIPRRINRLCDLALLIGYAEQRKSLLADQLGSIHDELVAVVPE